MNTVKFENGDEMPKIGLGTWKAKPGEVYEAVICAIETGYRHIDCAPIYNNEKEVGQAIAKAIDEGMVKREDLFITSKLWNNAHKKADVIPALKNSLKDLQLGYVDLYLIHWPIAQKPEKINITSPDDFISLQEIPILKTWEGMEEALNEGLTYHIGVSNFNIHKLNEIIDHAEFPPEMNQIELHPMLPQNELVEYCHENGIQVTGYAPLGSYDPSKKDRPNLIEDNIVKRIAHKHGVTSAQILLAWGMCRNTVVIPKSVNKERIKENYDSIYVKLEEVDMELLADLEGPHRFVDGTLWTIDGSPYSLDDLW
ncbi:aldo/keto reductase [Anditalea andensis]|uniref:Aldehyde oxidoreductase n=1 Tax=Anditalea andensis TaxID=1048983 RepID=A0A074KYE4_9BACT|nr:aldo/keto reductase [Anditalea andensis]KEO73979.1 aldehyde oxidoreductase [Anditalea andensis]